MTSRSFDRAAPFYDATRGLPETAVAETTALLAGELAGRGPCLEIGVGTGRIALPLHRAGIPMAGIDISIPMMEVLLEKCRGLPVLPVAQADATVLPFASGSFGSAVVSHVLHLVVEWRAALAELVRVVRPGGRVLSCTGGHERSEAVGAARRHFLELTGPTARHIGADHDSREAEAALEALGAGARALPVVTASRTTTVARMIDELESGVWSWTWSVPDHVLREAAEATRRWAAAELGPLDEPRQVDFGVRWQAFDLP